MLDTAAAAAAAAAAANDAISTTAAVMNASTPSQRCEPEATSISRSCACPMSATRYEMVMGVKRLSQLT